MNEYERLIGAEKTAAFGEFWQRFMVAPSTVGGLGPLKYGSAVPSPGSLTVADWTRAHYGDFTYRKTPSPYDRAQRAKDWQRVISSCTNIDDIEMEKDNATAEGYRVNWTLDAKGGLKVTVT